jgi:twitching motility protein PilU
MELEKLFQAIAQLQASDLYLKAGAMPMARVNGVLQSLANSMIKQSELEQLALQILGTKGYNALGENRESNVAYTNTAGERFRLNIYFQRGSIGMVFRRVILEIPTIEALALPLQLKEVALQKKGLFFVCGPTGSGKSTTLAAMLDFRNASMHNHILTIEDPIEFLYADKSSIVSQREVGLDTLSFENALKNSLRKAPDVISIGEVRDLDTAVTALTMSETGHLVFATLHASNTYQSLERLLSMFTADKEKQLLMVLSMNLIGLLAQRLIPRKGGKDRVVATEMLQVTAHVRELIGANKISDIKDVLRRGGQDGIYSFDQKIFELYENGEIEADDALTFADNPDEIKMRMKGFTGALRQV